MVDRITTVHDPFELQPPMERIHDFVEPLIEPAQEAFYNYWKTQESLLAEDEFNLHGENPVTHNPHVAFRREIRFINAVAGAVLKVDEREPYVIKTLLHDMDETVGNKRFGCEERFIRPGYGIVANALHQELGDWFETAALTTVGQDNLAAEITPALQKATPAVNPGMMISSKDSKYALSPAVTTVDSLDGPARHRERYNALRHLLDTGIVKESRPDRPTDWYDKKLAILSTLLETNEARFRTFVYADDLPSARVIDPNHSQLHGLHVSRKMRFHLPDSLMGIGYKF